MRRSRGFPGRRALRGTRGADPVRGAGELATAGRRADGGDSSALSGDGRRACPVGTGRFAALTAGLAITTGLAA